MNRDNAFLETIRAMFAEATLSREQMHKYQAEDAYNHLRYNPFSALFIDMGLGKTVSTATLVIDLLAEFSSDDPVLIIGPLRVATQTWPNEFKKWKHLAAYNVEVIHVEDDDPALKRAAALARQDSREHLEFPSEQEKAARVAVAQCKEWLRQNKAKSRRPIHVISRDWLEWLVNFYGRNWPYRTVIVDESSGFKDHKTGRYMALQAIAELPGAITRLHLLTATPAAESYEHLYSQLFLLDRGKRLGRSLTTFRDRYMIAPHRKDPSRKFKLRPGAEKEIIARISDICLVMKEEDYLPRVPPLFVEREVVMDDSQMKMYMTMEKDMLIKLDDDTIVKAETAAALSSKLLQMASGVLYDVKLEPGQDEDDDHVKVLKVHNIHTHKLDMLKQIVEEAQGRPLLVAYHFKSSKERLKKLFPWATVMDREGKCIKKWNQGKIPMLLMHPASGGHGLNLQEGGHNIVFYDIPFSLELYLQLIGRLARQGQKHRVLVQLLVCRGTLDHTVVQALAAKEDAQELLFKILKRMRARLRKLMLTKKITAENWDEVVDVLTDYSDDVPVMTHTWDDGL